MISKTNGKMDRINPTNAILLPLELLSDIELKTKLKALNKKENIVNRPKNISFTLGIIEKITANRNIQFAAIPNIKPDKANPYLLIDT
jgi:hypothetical protein